MSDYEDFCNDPACRDCGDSMYLDDGCEWPQNPELWLCTGCMTSYAESLKQQLDEATKQRDRLRDALKEIATGAWCIKTCVDVIAPRALEQVAAKGGES